MPIQQPDLLDTKYLQYKKMIFKALSLGKKLSAQEISYQIGKSLPLTTKILEELLRAGILQDEGLAHSTGGRRPSLYAISKGNIFVISVAMDQHITKIALIDLYGKEILHLEEFSFQLRKHSLNDLIGNINEYLSKGYVDRSKILGIGIGMPGFVDVKKGVNHSYFAEVNGTRNLPAAMEKQLGLPVFLDNDSSVIAITEQVLGAAAGISNALVINFGWGIGLGMILNGNLFRGNNGFAGEFSHIPLFNNNNKLCSCGKSGCLETEASVLVIVEKAREALRAGRASIIKDLPDDLEAASEIVISAALAGDQLAVELFSQTAFDIGRGIAILIHILNPEQIIISGRGAAAGTLLLAPIYQAINRYCIPSLSSYTKIVISDLSKLSEIYGAALLVIENFDERTITKFEKSLDLI